jgi:hypothetical protein
VVVDHVPELEGEGYEMLPHLRKSYVWIQSPGLKISSVAEYAYRGRVELDIRVKERRLGSELVAEGRRLLITGMKGLNKLPSVDTQVVSHISPGPVVYVVADGVGALKQPHIHVLVFLGSFCAWLEIGLTS